MENRKSKPQTRKKSEVANSKMDLLLLEHWSFPGACGLMLGALA